MVIAHNISALNTYKSLGIAGGAADKSMEKLSSGYKINRAGDDAAGLSISEKMRSQIRGLNQASTNAENGVSMIQTAEGALNEAHSILQRMRELAVQSATDTNASEDRDALQSELEQLSSEINRIGNTTEFNGMKILNGDKARTIEGGTANTWKVTFADITDGLTKEEQAANFVKDYSEVGYKVKDNADGTVTVTSKNMYATADEVTEEGTKMKTAIEEFCTDAGAAAYQATVATTAGAEGTEIDNSVYFHVGANENQVINTSFNDMRALKLGITIDETEYATLTDDEKALLTDTMTVNDGTTTVGVEYGLNIATREGANNAISVIDGAIKIVSDERSKFGAIQNRLEYTINNLDTTAENMQAAESTIRDVDMAEEMMDLTKNNILQQAAQAMLSQAMQRPQQALQLLQG